MPIKRKYEFIIRKPDGTTVATFGGELKNRYYSITRNRAEIIKFTLNLDEIETFAKARGYSNALDIFNPNINEVLIKKYDVPIIAGQINFAVPRIAEQGPIVEVRATGFLDFFKNLDLESELQYTGVDAGLVGWNVLDAVQSYTDADYGITQGAIQTSVDRNRTYPIYKNVKDLLIELSQVINGFDFEFTHDKKFNVFYPKIGHDRELVFRYPGNIRTLSFPKDGSKMANKVFASNASGLVGSFVDATSRAAYKLRHALISFPTVVNVETLEEHAESYVDNFKGFQRSIVLTIDGNRKPSIGDFQIGDVINIEVVDYTSFSDISLNQYKIDSIQVWIDDMDNETIQLGVSVL